MFTLTTTSAIGWLITSAAGYLLAYVIHRQPGAPAIPSAVPSPHDQLAAAEKVLAPFLDRHPFLRTLEQNPRAHDFLETLIGNAEANLLAFARQQAHKILPPPAGDVAQNPLYQGKAEAKA